MHPITIHSWKFLLKNSLFNCPWSGVDTRWEHRPYRLTLLFAGSRRSCCLLCVLCDVIIIISFHTTHQCHQCADDWDDLMCLWHDCRLSASLLQSMAKQYQPEPLECIIYACRIHWYTTSACYERALLNTRLPHSNVCLCIPKEKKMIGREKKHWCYCVMYRDRCIPYMQMILFCCYACPMLIACHHFQNVEKTMWRQRRKKNRVSYKIMCDVAIEQRWWCDRVSLLLKLRRLLH